MRTQKSILGFNIHQVSRRVTWKNNAQGSFALDQGDGKLKHFDLTIKEQACIVKGQFKGSKEFILN